MHAKSFQFDKASPEVRSDADYFLGLIQKKSAHISRGYPTRAFFRLKSPRHESHIGHLRVLSSSNREMAVSWAFYIEDIHLYSQAIVVMGLLKDALFRSSQQPTRVTVTGHNPRVISLV